MDNKTYQTSHIKMNIGDVWHTDNTIYIIKYRYLSKTGYLYEVEKITEEDFYKYLDNSIKSSN